MTTEEYIYAKLKKLTEKENVILNKMTDALGIWVTPQEVAVYLKKHINTIYNWLKEGILISKREGRGILIYSPSLFFVLND